MSYAKISEWICVASMTLSVACMLSLLCNPPKPDPVIHVPPCNCKCNGPLDGQGVCVKEATKGLTPAEVFEKAKSRPAN